MRWRQWTIAASVVLHGAIALAVVRMPKDAAKRSSLVSVVDKKKKPKNDEDKPAKADEPPPPPPKPIEKPRSAPKKVPVENTPPPPTPPPQSPVAAAHPALAALPNLNISMGNGPGGPGIAVPMGQPAGDAPAPAARGGDAPKATARPKEECAEDAVKPKLLGAIAQDRIVAAAQAAGGVEGKIRLEILVDEAGNVTSVRVMAGLGGAVDEAAVAAAKRVKVAASTRCGKAVAGRLVVAITVRNPD